MIKNFSDFQASRTFGDVRDDDAQDQQGYTYAGGFWIVQQDDGSYWTIIGYEEFQSVDLEAAEHFLWDGMARACLIDPEKLEDVLDLEAVEALSSRA